jgi:hypothetical protein
MESRVVSRGSIFGIKSGGEGIEREEESDDKMGRILFGLKTMTISEKLGQIGESECPEPFVAEMDNITFPFKPLK